MPWIKKKRNWELKNKTIQYQRVGKEKKNKREERKEKEKVRENESER